MYEHVYVFFYILTHTHIHTGDDECVRGGGVKTHIILYCIVFVIRTSVEVYIISIRVCGCILLCMCVCLCVCARARACM